MNYVGTVSFFIFIYVYNNDVTKTILKYIALDINKKIISPSIVIEALAIVEKKIIWERIDNM